MFPCHLATFLLHLLGLCSSQITVPEATGPLARNSAPDFCVVGVLFEPHFAPPVGLCRTTMHRNQFAPLKEEAGSPMSSVISVTAPTELGATVELAKPDKEWMDLQSWTLPPAAQSLDARRAEFDRCESTLLKAESELGFDVSMADMRPADVLRTTAHIAEESQWIPLL